MSIWIIVLIVCIVIEAATTALVTIWFIPASLIALIFEALNLSLGWQIISFVVSGLILLLTTKPLFEKLLKSAPKELTNVDALIGKRAIVVEEIDNIGENGAVKIEGKIWSARNFADSAKISAGEIVVIKAVSGVKLMCEKNNNEEENL